MSTQFALGTYRISDQDPLHIAAIKEAVQAGVKLIDTSSNYMDGGAERAIAMACHQSEEPLWRDVEIVSKFGYIQGSTLHRLQHEETFNNVVRYADHIWHCIDPDFMRDQLTLSLQRLQQSSLGCYLIHNPEYFLLHAIQRGIPLEERLDEMLQRIFDVFIAFEQEVAAGRISSYGISSNSFSKSMRDPEFLPYDDLMTLAKNAAKKAGNPSHSFTTIQLPINMLETEGLKCAAWAKHQGLRVLVNRPLNAQYKEKTVRLAEYDESKEYFHYLNELLEISEHEKLRPLHNLLNELDAYKHRFGWIGDYEQFFHVQLIPSLRKMVEPLPDDQKASLLESLQLFFDSYRQMVAHECGRKTRMELKDQLADCNDLLQHCALDFLKRDEIDMVLVGMRKPTYVHDVMSL